MTSALDPRRGAGRYAPARDTVFGADSEVDVQNGWLERYAEVLGVEPLTEDEVAALLDLARDVAHGAERRFAPLSTFLAGVAAGADGSGGRPATIRRAVADAEDLLGDG